MAEKENIYGIKYEVDIESLKQSTSEAQKQIKLANSEFNRSASELDDWATSVEGVSAKIKQMNTILEAQKTKLAQSQKEYNDNIDSLEKYADQIDEAKRKKQELITQYGEESQQVKEATNNIDRLEREQTALIKATDNLKVSINNQQATVNKTEKSLKYYEEQLSEVKEAQDRAEKSGRSLEEELEDIRKKSDEAEDSTNNLSDGFTVMKGALANLIATGISSFISYVGSAIEETREFRTELGKLEATAETMGASFDNVKDNLREVNSITEDTGAGVEGLNNLLSAGFDGEALDKITDELLGASIKWKDTLKFEGLSDGLQETLATKSAVGPFSELIERAGGSLETFDKGLQKAIKDGTEQNYILEYLSQYGLASVKEAYEENNKTLIDSVNATYDYQDVLAKFGEVAEPVLTALKSGFASFLETLFGVREVDLSPLTEGINKAFSTINGLISGDISFSEVIDNIYQSIMDSVPKLFNAGTEMLANIGKGIKENIPDVISNGLTMIDNFVTMIGDNLPTLIKSGMGFIKNLVQGLMEALPELIARVPEIISKFANLINDNAPTIIMAGVGIIMDIITGLIKAIPTLIANIPKIITAIVDVWEAFNWLNLGKKAMTSLDDGIKSMKEWLKTTITNIRDSISGAISGLPQTLLNFGKSMMNNFTGAISGAIGSVKGAITTIFNAIWNGLKGLPSKLVSVGSDLVKGLWNGISDMTGWILGKIQGFGESILGGIKSFFGIHSPSKETAYLGEMIGLGLGNGLAKMSDYVVNQASKVSNQLMDGLRSNLDNITYSIDPARMRTGVQASANGVGATGNVTNVTFNQYNSSPEPMDSLEIYRNTRKQMQQFKAWGGTA